MDLIPAVDLLDGVAVRLAQGDYDRRVAEESEPAGLIETWIAAGSEWLHLVDLSGARSGRPVHLELARGLARTARSARGDVRVELGGGIRRDEDLEAVLNAGIDVAIIGSAAVERPAFLPSVADRWPGRVAVSIDVRDDRVATRGWTQHADRDPVDIAQGAVAAGVAHVIVTDVSRDGTKGGPNLDLLARVREAVPATRLVAAGGISTAEDVRRLADAGVDGAIVGLALLDGSLPVEVALAAARGAGG